MKHNQHQAKRLLRQSAAMNTSTAEIESDLRTSIMQNTKDQSWPNSDEEQWLYDGDEKAFPDDDGGEKSPMNVSHTVVEVLPSLSDAMLRKLCLLRDNTASVESLSEWEIDHKFRTLSLAFRTDQNTLQQRADLYRHQRDMVESGASDELHRMHEYISQLRRLIFSVDSHLQSMAQFDWLRALRDLLDRLEWQCSVVRSVCNKIASKCELYGAVRQEERLSMAFELIFMHLQNLTRAKERDRQELQDTKRLLSTGSSGSTCPLTGPSSAEQCDSARSAFQLLRQSSADDDQACVIKQRALRTISGQVPCNSKINRIRVRRASVASIDIGSKEVTRRTHMHGYGRAAESPVTTTTTTTTTFEYLADGPTSTTSTTTTVTSPPGSEEQEDESAPPQPESELTSNRRLSVPSPDWAVAVSTRPKLRQLLSQTQKVDSEGDGEPSFSDDPVHASGRCSRVPSVASDLVDQIIPEDDDEWSCFDEESAPVADANESQSDDTALQQQSDQTNEQWCRESAPFAPLRAICERRRSSYSNPKANGEQIRFWLWNQLGFGFRALGHCQLVPRTVRNAFVAVARDARRRASVAIEQLLLQSWRSKPNRLLEAVTKNKHADQIRSAAALCLLLLSVFIVIWSILLPTVLSI